MARVSFSASVKEALMNTDIKKKCCRRSFSDASSLFQKNEGFYMTPCQVLDSLRCDGCMREFLKAAFISCGSVTAPEKRNHLDYTFADTELYNAVKIALENAGFFFGETTRRGKSVLYLKDNDVIGDFLAYIGATRAAFDVMNTKIMKELRNNANRQVNCDTANIEKAISASQKYIEAIEYLKEKGAIATLPPELREAAELRETYSQASLTELAKKCRPAITKSGIKHRLEKLLTAAEELQKETENS